MAKLTAIDLTSRAAAGTTFTPHLPVLNDDGEFVAITGADGAPATITLCGADAPQAKAIVRAQRAQMQTRVAAMAFTGRKQEGVTADDIALQEEFDLELVCACTIAWTGFEDDDGAPLPCTPEHRRALYVAAPYLVEQALRHLRDRSRFFGPSSMPSEPPLAIGSA